LTDNEEKFEDLKDYILNSATKLPDGTPIFSARYFVRMIEQASLEWSELEEQARKLAEKEYDGSQTQLEKRYLFYHLLLQLRTEWFSKYFGEKSK
jgi:hypothetical protein